MVQTAELKLKEFKHILKKIREKKKAQKDTIYIWLKVLSVKSTIRQLNRKNICKLRHEGLLALCIKDS